MYTSVNIAMNKITLCILLVVSAIQAQEIGARYLIITHDNFYDAVLPLAEWKHKKGMRTKIAKLSETGSAAGEIKNYITNVYNNWQIPPEFLLLVGAPNYLPFIAQGGVVTDNYYTNMDGDIFNEILSGRLTVHNVTEAQTVINKILLYERTPDLTDSSWFINACLIVNVDYYGHDTVYWNDIRHARNLMLSNGYDVIDELCDSTGDDANDVIQSVNAGRAFVLYRGQGLNNWSYPFSVNPDLTNNGKKLPIVLSVTCRTIGTSSTPATAEKWLLTGTPTTPRGGAGYFATTTTGSGFITFLRSAVCRGFFNALFVDGVTTFGEACEGGRMNVYNLYGSASEYRGFTTLGDPEMNIWTDTPCALIVSHPAVIPIGSASFTVNVSRADNSLPVSGATVCVVGRMDTILYAVDSTDPSGNVYFSINPQIIDDTVDVTVTGLNLKPYEGYMFTITSGLFVGYLRSVIDDSLGGNDDGIINPGEEINLPLWVKNFGDSTAYGVTGILHTSDPYATINDSVKSFGTIVGGDSAFSSTNGYDFAVSSDASDGHVIDFELVCRDINDSVWTSYFSEVVCAADLVFESAEIGGGNFEPGDTVTAAVIIRNEGSADIDNVTAHLHSLSPYAGIIDSVGSYVYIPAGGSVGNSADPFVVYADVAAPHGTLADFQMVVSAGYYFDTLDFSLCIGRKAYYIWNPDGTPAPGQNMHAILSGLGYSGDYGTTLDSDLNLYQSVWVCVGVYPNNYVISSGGPEATALVDYLQGQSGRMYLEGGDVWYFDPPAGYDFGPLFGINAVGDGSSNMGPVIGHVSTFTEGMNFDYAGENSFMDHISPGSANAFLIFRDANDDYDCGVAYDEGSYRTVGASFELGLLTDGAVPSTRAALLDSIMHFFGISTGVQESKPICEPTRIAFDIFPNPCRDKVTIKYCTPDAGMLQDVTITLAIYDTSGRLIDQLRQNSDPSVSVQTIIWHGEDEFGRRLPNGVYFVRFETADHIFTEKIIFLR